MTMRIAAILSACLALASPAFGQMKEVSCDDTARMADTLTKVMRAERHGTGLRDPETMLEVWVTPTNGDWLIVQTYANGTSCIVAMGAHWEGALPGPA